MRFVDAPYRSVVTSIELDPSSLRTFVKSLHPNLMGNFAAMVSRLNRYQKALLDCLEAKRSVMPRLYFVGDDELLEMIGQGSKVEAVQTCLKKLFQAISAIKLDDKRKSIISIESESGEIVAMHEVSYIDNKGFVIAVVVIFLLFTRKHGPITASILESIGSLLSLMKT